MRVAHADWGTNPSKQWVAVAQKEDSGTWVASAPQPTAPSGSLRDRMHVAGTDTVALGFDFPIGLPRRFAEAAGITSFRDLLGTIGQGRWRHFFDVADQPEKVSLERPFYPNTGLSKGSKKREHLTDALGLGFEELLRRCERPQPNRRAATPIFWTLGGGQVGKGAISGWKLLQAEDLGRVLLWPFDGPLVDLLDRANVVVAETYPAEFYRHLGMGSVPGKRRREIRKECSTAMLAAAGRLGIQLDAELETAIRDGFGSSSSGEDPFDAVTGLFGMINVISGQRAEGTPADDAAVTVVEGWMLGQDPEAPPESDRAAASAPGLTQLEPVSGVSPVELAIEAADDLGPREKNAVLDLYRTLREG